MNRNKAKHSKISEKRKLNILNKGSILNLKLHKGFFYRLTATVHRHVVHQS
jgi:hypothetical protein